MSDLNLDRTEFLKLSRQIRRMTFEKWQIMAINRFGGHIKPAGRPIGKRLMARARRNAGKRISTPDKETDAL